MAAYMIFIREGEVTDHEAMTAYQNSNRSGPPPEGLKPLVVYGALETLEGDKADGVVILEFPDKESASNWYYSPDYQAAIKHRQKAAPYRCIMVEGL